MREQYGKKHGQRHNADCYNICGRNIKGNGGERRNHRRIMEATEFNRLLKRMHSDVHSLEKLYNYYYPRIIGYLSPKYGKELAEDSAQEFFLHLIDIAANQAYIKMPTSWMYACAENAAKRRIQYESRYTNLPDDIPDKKIISKEEEFGDLYGAIKNLDEISQKIIKLYYWDGYNQYEIAELLKLKPATVRKKHSRAVKKIKKLL